MAIKSETSNTQICFKMMLVYLEVQGTFDLVRVHLSASYNLANPTYPYSWVVIAVLEPVVSTLGLQVQLLPGLSFLRPFENE